MSTGTYVSMTCAGCGKPITELSFTWTGTGMFHNHCVSRGNVTFMPAATELVGWQWRRAGEPWPEKWLTFEPALTAPNTEKRALYAGPVIAYGVNACDGYRTSADGLTRTKVAPDAAAPTVPSECVTLRMGADGRLHTHAPDAPKSKPLPKWEPCNEGCDPEFGGFRTAHCKCDAAKAALGEAPTHRPESQPTRSNP